MILDKLKAKMEEAVYTETKNSMYAHHLSMIEALVSSIKKEKPDFDPTNLVTKLSEAAEKCSEQEANAICNFKKEAAAIAFAEMEAYKQVQVTA